MALARVPLVEYDRPPVGGVGGVVRVRLDHLLAEPPANEPAWLEAVTRRLVAADAGAQLSPDPDVEAEGWPATPEGLESVRGARDRAERAGWGWPLTGTDVIAGLGIGSLGPRLIVVGEAPRSEGQLPLHARSGAWLWPALRAMGWDELEVRAINACRRDGTSDPALARLVELTRRDGMHLLPGARWLALGRRAHEACLGLGVDAIPVAHPAHARRFRFGAGHAGYASRLEAAGLPHGGWDGLGRVAWPAGTPLPALPSPVGDVPPHHRGRPRLGGEAKAESLLRARLLRRRRDLRLALADAEARLEAAGVELRDREDEA